MLVFLTLSFVIGWSTLIIYFMYKSDKELTEKINRYKNNNK